MGNKLVGWGLAFVLVLGCIGCRKLEPVPVVTALPAIPLDYGDLVAVVPSSTDPRFVALWFQRADKSISIHWVNISTGALGSEIEIPRK